MLERFAWPEAWPLVFLPVLVWAFLRWSEVRRNRRLAGLCTANRIQPLCEELSPGRRLARRGMKLVAVLCVVIAVLQPLYGEDESRRSRPGTDIVIALDVSRSMQARDVVPDRLQHALDEARALAGRVEGDRLGLVVFAGEARLLVPLTRDLETFVRLLDTTDSVVLARGGSDLGTALDRASLALEEESGGIVLLLSDGEDLEQQGLPAAERARERGITVHSVGFGSVQGSKIVVQLDGAERFLQDAGGREVISALDEDTLRRIAETTGGEFVAAADSTSPLVELYERSILPTERRTLEQDVSRERKNRFQWPLAAGIVLLLLELSWSERRRG